MKRAEAADIPLVRGGAQRFWFLIAANYIAWIGSVITLIAVPLYVFESTGRAFDAGLAGAANTLPMALGSVVGGTIVDRIGPRLAGAAAGLTGAVCMFALPTLQATIGLPFGLLLILLFLRSMFDTPTAAARLSLLSELTDDAGYSQDTANAIFQAGQRVAFIAGPPFAAFLIAMFGAVTTLYIDAIAFAAAAFILLAAASRSKPPRTYQSESLVEQFVNGVQIICRNKPLLSMGRIFVITNLIESAFVPVILPVYARGILGNPLLVSLPTVFFGLGALIGTFAYIPIAKLAPSRFSIFIASLLIISLSRAALIVEPDAIGLASLSFMAGFASGPLNPIMTILVQNSVPAAALGRTFGAIIGIAFSAIPLGIFLAGVLVEATGLHATLIFYAVTYIAITIHAATNNALRAM